MASKYSHKILELSRGVFNGSFSEEDQKLVVEAMRCYTEGNYERIDEILAKLDDAYKLLEALVVKLKGKSVYTNLKNLMEHRAQSSEELEISLSSLYTHVCIECKTDPRYKKLKPGILKKIVKLQK